MQFNAAKFKGVAMKSLKLVASVFLIILFPVLVHAAPIEVIITSPPPGFVTTNSPSLNFSTTAEISSVKIDEGTPMPIVSGASIGPLGEGTHTVRVDASDTAGNSGFAEVTFTIDTIPPTIGLPPVAPLKISAKNHYLELKRDGTIWSWGNNGSGQLGDGTIDFHQIPVQIGKEALWADVAAGGGHSLSIRSVGTLWAWGSNTYGQLGDGTTENRMTPVQVGSDTDWSAVAAGSQHSVALKRDGTLWAWGYNYHGELGDGTTTFRQHPIKIGNDTDWASISVGSDHTVATKKDGTLWAWGFNYNGQLGDGTFLNRSTPVRVGSDTDWKIVVAGGAHTVAIKQAGSMWTWGYNYYGQLGDGTTQQRSTPARVGNGTNWSAVAVGIYHTLALNQDGTIWAWGYNYYGQLGDGTTQNRTTPVRVGNDTDWSMVAVGSYHSMAAKEDGASWNWGRNYTGSIGSYPTPALFTGYGSGMSINAGARATNSRSVNATFVVTDANGVAEMQSSNDNATWSTPETYATSRAWELPQEEGIKTVYTRFKDAAGNWSEPVSASILFDTTPPVELVVTKISSAYHTLAVSSSGSMLSWGANRHGQLGEGSFADKSWPVAIGQANSWSAVAAGEDHNTALGGNGSLWAWGFNDYGQLGDGTLNTRPFPVQIGSDTTWTAVASGDFHSYAMKQDGTLWSWGDNWDGELGDGTYTNRMTPGQVGMDTDWLVVAAGGFHTLALKRDGALWAWGYNGYGQLGDGTLTERTTPVRVGSDTDWSAVAAGDYHTVALKQNGTLWSWGDNDEGGLGDGTVSDRSTPVQVGSDTDWATVAAGMYHTLALKRDGSLWAWGYNEDGELGDGTLTNRLTPVRIGTDTDWSSVEGGDFHTVAIKQDGSLWAWGANGHGQVGDGTTTDKTKPVLITSPGGVVINGTAAATNSRSVTLSLVVADFGGVAEMQFSTDSQSWSTPVPYAHRYQWSLGEGDGDGIKRVYARFKDEAGNWSNPFSDTIELDTTPPTIVITSPVAGSTGDNTPLLYFTVSEGTPVVKVDGLVVSKAVGDSLDVLSNGPHTVRVESADTVGNVGSAEFAFTVDAVPPTVIITSPVSEVSNNSTPLLAYTVSEGSVVVKVDGIVSPKATGDLLDALADGEHTVYVEATNASGNAGTATVTFSIDTVPPAATPSVVGVYTGFSHTFALLNDASLWAWGSNTYGQLGNGTTQSSRTPVRVGSVTDWSTVAGGNEHSIAVDLDGRLWTWGYNKYGQLGDGTTENRATPVQIGSGTDWASVVAGSHHSVALKQDGTLWTWGYNSGTLGDGAYTNRVIPGQVGIDTDWSAIAAGYNHTFALRQDGTLWAWGHNVYGELGDGTTQDRPIPAKIGYGTAWSAVAAGVYHTVALKQDGTLWAWGFNFDGQLGDGTTENRTIPVQVGSETNWKAVVAGYNFSVGLKKDGSLWAWGSNYAGQLGDGTYTDRLTPVRIGSDTDWIAQASAGSRALALKQNLTLWAWGNNSNGELGDGTDYNRSIPVAVTGLDSASGYLILKLINNGAVATNNPTVTLNFSANDLHGVEAMKFSNDNQIWSESEPYAGTRSWSLSEGDGLKTVYVKFKDTLSNWSESYRGRILLDTSLPTVTITSPPSGLIEVNNPLLEYSVSEGRKIVKVDGTIIDKLSGNLLEPLTDGLHTIRIESADLAGNSAFAEVTFTVDAPPVTTVSVSCTKDQDGSCSEAATVTLSTAFSVNDTTYYSFDGTTWQTYTTPLLIDQNRNITLYYRSVDPTGHEEAVKIQSIRVNTTGIVGLWHMDNDWLDGSIMGRNGTSINGATFSPSGKIGTAAGSFDGSNDHVDIYLDVPDHNFTIEAWAKTSTAGGLFSVRGPYFYHDHDRHMYVNADGYACFRVSAGQGWCTTTKVNDNFWHHWALVVQTGVGQKAYIDGQLAGTNSYDHSDFTSEDRAVIGYSEDMGFFNGLIDEVTIYNRPLSADEIGNYYQSYSLTPPTVDPVPPATTNPVIMLSGAKPANSGIDVNGQVLVPADASATWQASYTLTPGVNTLIIKAVYAQRLSQSVTVNVALDRTPPTIADSNPATITVVGNVDSITVTLADALSAVDLTASVVGAVVSNPSGTVVMGSWSIVGANLVFSPAQLPLAEGRYTVTVNPVDTLGNQGSDSFSFTINKTSVVGLWHMDNDWLDASIMGHDGTPANSATFTTDRIFGAASGKFQGGSDYVAIGNLYGNFPDNTFSIEAWLLLNDTGNGGRKTFAGGVGASSDYAIGLMDNELMVVTGNHSGVFSYARSGFVPNIQQWYHVAGTFDGSMLKLYVNGELKSDIPAAWVQSNGAVDFRLGGSYCCSGNNFNGLMDEVVAHNRALNPEEILAHYTAGITGDSTPPAGAIVINNGANFITQTSVTLTTSADDVNGVSQMCISNTPDCTTWETYATTKAWTLPAGDGAKTVYAWYTDTLGNATQTPYTAAITLDTIPLTVSVNPVTTPTKTKIQTLSGTKSSEIATGIVINNTLRVPLNSDATWSYAYSLAEGVNTLTIVARDAVGKESPPIAPAPVIVLDSTPPMFTVDSYQTPSPTAVQRVSGRKESGCVVKLNGSTIFDSVDQSDVWSYDVTLTEGTANHLVFNATDAQGNLTTKAIDILYDISPPLALVTGALSADGNGRGIDVNLSWSSYPEPNDLAYYRVYLAQTNFTSVAGMTPIATVTKGTRSDKVSGLTAGAVYFFAVVPVDKSGNADQSVHTAQAIPTDTLAPEDVTGLTAAAGNNSADGNFVILTWSASANSTGDLADQVIYLDAGPGILIGKNAVTYTLKGLSDATLYRFKVTVKDALGHESAGAAVQALTRLSNPMGLSAVAGNQKATLAWNAVNSPYLKFYNIYRLASVTQQTDSGAMTLIKSQSTTSFTDSSLVNGTTYQYAVTVVNTSGAERTNVQSVATAPRADTTGPVISGLNLTANQTIAAPVTISAFAQDGENAMDRLELSIDGAVVKTESGSSISHTWNVADSTDGNHTVKLGAYDAPGNLTEQTVPVVVSLARPTAPAITGHTVVQTAPVHTVSVSGTTQPGATVSLRVNDVVVSQMVSSTPAFTFNAVNLVEGDNLIAAKAVNRGGESPFSADYLISVDTGAPPAPLGLAAKALAGGSIQFSWQAGAGETSTGFNLYESTTPFNSIPTVGVAKVNSTPNLTTLKEYIPADDTPRYYGVTALDNAGNESPISIVVQIASDRLAPTLSNVGFTPIPDPPSPIPVYGPGTVTVSFTVSEPLKELPFFSLEPTAGSPVVPFLRKLDDTHYEGSFTLDATSPHGATSFKFSGKDLISNRGSASGTGPVFDVKGPVADIQAPLGIMKTSAGPVAVTLVFDEPSVATPALELRPADGAAIMVTGLATSDNGLHWSGTLDPNGLPDGKGQFAVTSSQDRFGNRGSTVKSGASILVYQNTLPAPAVPEGLAAKPAKGGSVLLSWSTVADAQGYYLYRQGEGDAAPLQVATVTSAATTAYTDTPASDGTYRYTISTVGLLTSESSRSAEVSAVSDRMPPEAPTDLNVTLTGNGVQATWEATAPAEIPASYRLYRAGNTIIDLAGLTSVSTVQGAPAIDPAPASASRFYAVTAIDAAGNESVPSGSQEITFSVTPVRNLVLTRADAAAPSLTWEAEEANLQGFHIYRNGKRITQAPTLSTMYSDGYYTGGAVAYGISAVNNLGTESPIREVTLPALSIGLKEGTILRRGLLETIKLVAVNPADAANPVTIDEVRLSIGTLPESVLPGPFMVTQGAALEIPKVAATESAAPPQVALFTTAVMHPAPGTTVKITRSSVASVISSGTALEIFNEPLARGATGKIRIKVNNLGSARSEFLTGEAGGPTKLVTVYLRDPDGNILAQGNLHQLTGNIAIADAYNTVRIEPGATFLSDPIEFPVPVAAPDKVTIEAVIDTVWYDYHQPDQVTAPGLKQSTSVSIIDVAYHAAASTDKPLYKQGETVVISGQTLASYAAQPMPLVPIKIGLSVNGFDRFFTVTSDLNGTFNYIFTPASNEAGIYSVWAAHPEVNDRTAQAQFSIIGFSISPDFADVRMARSQSVEIPVTLVNSSATDLTGLAFSVDASSGITGTVLNSGDDRLASGETQKITFKLTPQQDAPDSASAYLTISTSEGIDQSVALNISLVNGNPAITTTPSYIDTGMTRGVQKMATFRITNSGIATLKNGRIEGPSLAWISLTTDRSLGDIAAGESREIGLLLKPGENVPQGVYEDRLTIHAENHLTYIYNIQVTVASNSVGNVQFSVLNELMKDVAGAAVTIQNQAALDLIYTLNTDERGTVNFFDLPEGRYVYNISAPRTLPTSGSFVVEPGLTITVPVAMEVELVGIEWSVTPVEFEDRYDIKITQTFETNVPTPVLVAEPPSVTLPNMQPGEVFNGEYSVTNYGLIAVDTVNLNFPTSVGDYDIEVLTSVIPKRINAMQKIRVPYRITRRYNYASLINPLETIFDNVRGFGGSAVPCPAGARFAIWLTGVTIICPGTDNERTVVKGVPFEIFNAGEYHRCIAYPVAVTLQTGPCCGKEGTFLPDANSGDCKGTKCQDGNPDPSAINDDDKPSNVCKDCKDGKEYQLDDGVVARDDSNCCYQAEPVPNSPVTDAEKCPNMKPKFGHIDTSNGCGPEGILGSIYPIPNNPIWWIQRNNSDYVNTWRHTVSDGSFFSACNSHDVCYGGCDGSKAGCDSQMRTSARSACYQGFPLSGDPYLNQCLNLAYIYYSAVSEHGYDVYNSAVKENCNCCFE